MIELWPIAQVKSRWLFDQLAADKAKDPPHKATLENLRKILSTQGFHPKFDEAEVDFRKAEHAVEKSVLEQLRAVMRGEKNDVSSRVQRFLREIQETHDKQIPEQTPFSGDILKSPVAEQFNAYLDQKEEALNQEEKSGFVSSSKPGLPG